MTLKDVDSLRDRLKFYYIIFGIGPVLITVPSGSAHLTVAVCLWSTPINTAINRPPADDQETGMGATGGGVGARWAKKQIRKKSAIFFEVKASLHLWWRIASTIWWRVPIIKSENIIGSDRAYILRLCRWRSEQNFSNVIRIITKKREWNTAACSCNS